MNEQPTGREAFIGQIEDARQYLEPALARANGEWAFSDIRARLLAEDMQLWLGEGFAAVTEVLNYPQRRVVMLHLAGGNMQELMADIPKLEAFARLVGASGVEIIGRKGWTRVLSPHGFRESAVHLFKEV